MQTAASPQTPLQEPIALPKPPSMTTTYALIILVVVLGALVAVLAVNIFRSGEDNSLLIGAIFVALPPTLGVILTFFKAQAVGAQVDGGFTQFAKTLQERAHAAGVQEAEDRQVMLKADEVRIAGLVAEQVAAILRLRATQPVPTLEEVIAPTVAPVDVVMIKPDAAQAIADAVAPAAAQGALERIAGALPPPAGQVPPS